MGNKHWKFVSSSFSAILLHIEQSFKEALHTIMNLIPLHLTMITFKRGLRCFMNTMRGLLGGARQNIFLRDIEFEGTFFLDRYGVSRIYRVVFVPPTSPNKPNLVLG